jgi:DNA-binding YbaB/EbfC family protein
MNRIIMNKARQLQEKLEKTKQELEKETVEASSGGGAVTVVMTGQQEVKSVKISPEAVDDVEMLEDLVLTAMNEALRKSQELAASRMGDLTSGLKIPGLT